MRNATTLAGIAVALALALTAATSWAGGPGGIWVLLGERTVTAAVDVDVLNVPAIRGSFDRLYLKVKGSAVHFLDMRVSYRNGTSEDIPIRAIIPAGGNTRVIDLAGGNRFIERIRMTYQRIVGGGPAVVEFYAQR